MTLNTYIKRDSSPVFAIQLTMDLTEFRYQKWGNAQQAKAGDWLVSNAGETYTVDQESFSNTYRFVGDACYVKSGIVWAEVASESGAVSTKEGETLYAPGDFLVYNEPDKKDGYAITADKFFTLYKKVDGQMTEAATKSTTDANQFIAQDNAPRFTLNDYLSRRVDAQIEWYENKAAANKKLYTKLQVASILCGSMVPILTVVTFDRAEFLIRLLIALLGSAVAVISAVTTLHKFEDNWVKYRTAAQLLMREKQFLLTQTKPYNAENAFSIFVQNCEAILAAENSQWHQMFSAKTEKDESKG